MAVNVAMVLIVKFELPSEIGVELNAYWMHLSDMAAIGVHL